MTAQDHTMVFIAAILAIFLTVSIFSICLTIALLTAQQKRAREIRLLGSEVERLAEQTLTPAERAEQARQHDLTAARLRRTLDVYQD